MTEQEKYDLINYRKQRAWETFEDAKVLFERKSYFSALNRLYYSVYYMILALFLTDGISVKTHSGLLRKFSEYYVKTDIFDKSYSKILHKLFDYRTKADYVDFFEIEPNEVLERISETEDFLNKLESYLFSDI